MKKLLALSLLAMSLFTVSCGSDDDDDDNRGYWTFTANGVSFQMVIVDGGTFQMGDENGYFDEKPVHEVTLSPFAIGRTEVTQELWEAVMGTNPSESVGNKLPVENVTWNDCQTFITKLNQITGKTFRLPTEAEWEFAARGGNKKSDYTYSGSNSIDAVAWYDSNSGDTTHEVATKSPNKLGIYDMSGNVGELCQDWYSSDYYSHSTLVNPTGPTSGTERIERGGSCGDTSDGCRIGYRHGVKPSAKYYNLGLRLAL